MKNIKHFVIAIVFVTIPFTNLCFAQSQEAETLLDNTKLTYFERSANYKDSDILFKALYYNVPYPKYYYVLNVFKNGKVLTYRNVPSWAIQASQRAVLNDEQLKELKNLISEISTKEGHSPFLKPEVGEKYTAFVYLNSNENQKRMDFIGDLPSDIERLISFAQKVLKENNSIYKSETKEVN